MVLMGIFFLFSSQPGRHESTSTFNYVHKIHAATNKISSDGSSPTPTKLWSVARLSLECNNNTSNTLEERNSFYQHLSQMQHKNFQHQVDANASSI